MADEAALALQPGGSPSAVAAEREAASPPAGEPFRKRPRRDCPGLGRSPGEPGGAAPEREVPAATGGCPAAAAALWREAAAAGGEREAQAPTAGEGDKGPGLQGLSREPPPADDFDDDDDDDDEGEEEEEAAAAAAIGYRGAQGAGGRDCASPPPSRGLFWCGVGGGSLRRAGGSGLVLRRPSPHRGPQLCASTAGGRAAGAAGVLPPSGPFPPSAARLGGLRALRSRRAGKLPQLVLKFLSPPTLFSILLWLNTFRFSTPLPCTVKPATFAGPLHQPFAVVFAN